MRRVSVVVPTLDEAGAIGPCLDRIAAQDGGGVAEIVEVLVVDGGSTDGTAARAAERPGVRVLDNPDRIQAAALNRALEEAKGEVLVRVDAHALIAEDYVAACVAALERTGAALVGGAQRPLATTIVQRGMAAAMGSRLGVGAAAYHDATRSGWVDTVWMGAFRVDDAVAVGGYDAGLAVNEDADLADRLAPLGGVWLDAGIVAHYLPRTRVRDVVRQWTRYGYWRGRRVAAQPSRVRPRQLAVPALLLVCLTPARRVALPCYAGAVLAGAATAARRDRRGAVAYLFLVPLTHLSWGTAFLAGLLAGRRRARR